MKSLPALLATFTLTFLAALPAARANVVIAGTRVVFAPGAHEVTLRLTNEGDRPALVEAWLDDGDPTATPDSAHVPFLVTPPLARMNAGKGQSLRIVHTGAAMPEGRESLYWLNVLEVPPRPAATDGETQNSLQFAVRSRIKVFFRPAGLKGDPLTAGRELGWKLVADGAGYALEASNPTPFHVTVSAATLHVGGANYASEPGMLAPHQSLRLALKDLTRAPGPGATLDYTVINDFGAPVAWQGRITP